MAKYTLKILQSEQRKIYKVCLANFLILCVEETLRENRQSSFQIKY